MVAILFVCLGNICRSPAAQGIFENQTSKDPAFSDIHVESCGMGDWHVGQLPDPRIRVAAKNRGVILASRAQLFDPSFLERFDYILAADHEVLRDLYRFAMSPEHKAKIHLMTVFSNLYKDQEIPDPYYGGDMGFELVLDMLEDSCQGLLTHLKNSKK